MKTTTTYNISERKFFLRFFDNIAVISGVFLASKYLSFFYFEAFSENAALWMTTLSIYILFFGQIFDLYNLKVSSSRFLVFRSLIATTFVTTFFYIFTPIISPILPESRIQIFYLFFAIFLPLLIWRFIYISFVFLPKFHKFILIIGEGEELIDLIQLIEQKIFDTNIVGYISEQPLLKFDKYKHFDLKNKQISDIVDIRLLSEIVVLPSKFSKTKIIHNQLIRLFENGVPIISANKFIESATRSVPDLGFKDTFYDYLTINKNHQSNLYLVFTRFLDIIVSFVGVLFLTTLLPFVFIGNLLLNKGGLFYFQDRIGKNGEVFNIIKLRTMVVNAEQNGAVWAQKNDSRITAFGKFLRKTRLDEIPQFLNILRGDMSLIGPRPERPEFVNQLEEQLPFYAIRHVIKPGLTGWAQVMYPYANTVEEQKIKLRYDLYYIKERDLLLDFRIFIKTFTTILFFKGQ